MDADGAGSGDDGTSEDSDEVRSGSPDVVSNTGRDRADSGDRQPAEGGPPGFTRSMLPAAAGTALLFVLIQVGALSLVEPFVSAGYQQVEDPSDPANSVLYLVVVLVATGVILLVVRLGIFRLLRVFVAFTVGLLGWYVFSVVAPPLVGGAGATLALALAAVLAVAVYAYPEWYVIDVAGVVVGAGGAALFGISFGPLPALLLLVALAVYDALAVYRTEHMLTLAESVTDLKLPLVLVVPLSLSYSFLDDAPVDASGREGDGENERDAFLVGLGDAVIPTVLVATAAVFVEAPPLGVPGLRLTLPAAGAMLGTLAGLAGLLWMVARGRAHAGLPLLNGGAIAGYLVGALLVGVSLVEALGLGPYV